MVSGLGTNSKYMATHAKKMRLFICLGSLSATSLSIMHNLVCTASQNKFQPLICVIKLSTTCGTGVGPSKASPSITAQYV